MQVKDAKLGGNAVVIRGGKLVMDNSKIAVAAVDPGDAADVKMETSVGLVNQSSIEATALSDFANNDVVSVAAPAVSIASGSFITSLGGGGVSAGNLRVTAQSRWSSSSCSSTALPSASLAYLYTKQRSRWSCGGSIVKC